MYKLNYIRPINYICPRHCILLARTDTIAIARLQFKSPTTDASNEVCRMLELLQVPSKTNSSAKNITLPMKLQFFGFSVLYSLWVFPNLVFGFRFCQHQWRFFGFFCPIQNDTIFLVSPRKLHSAVVLKR